MRFETLLSRFSSVSGHADGGYLARCPAHNDNNPSLRIWRGEDLKVRLTCRAGCATEDVIRAVGLVWSDLFDCAGEGMTVSAERPPIVGDEYVSELAAYVEAANIALGRFSSEIAGKARAYVDHRFGLDTEAAIELGLGVDDGSGYGFPYLSRAYKAYPRLTVPLYGFDGVARGLQGRDLSGQCPGRWVSIMNPEGARWAPYGVLRGQGGYRVAIVTEGPGDALTAVSVGYDAVAIRGATLAGNPELAAELSAGLTGYQVIVCGDRDDAGERFARRLAESLSAHGIEVYAIEIPRDGDDLTRWRERDPSGFPAALHRAVKNARPVLGSALVDADTGALVPSEDDAQRAVRLMTELAERYGASDVLNAHALVAFTGGNIKYAPGLGFYVWNGRVWERSDTKVRQAIHHMGAALTAAAASSDEGSELRKVARGFTVTRHIDSLMTELRAVPSVHLDATAFDSHPELLSFRNGTVDLRTGELRPHDKADLITYCLDIDYVPDAPCPRWELFLAEIFPGKPELVDYVQRLIGYGITGNTSEQCFAVLWGKGANGKTVFTETLTKVFRAITKTTPFNTFEERTSGAIPNDIAALRGHRLVMASEGDAGKPMSEALLKRVTGSDMISARFLRKEFFEYKPSFLILLASNHKPKFRSQDEGLWRRVKMIPFQRWFAPEERDYGLGQKLLAEAEGIAAWAVRGAMDWYAGGLRDPDVIKAAVREYRETSDALAGFYPGIIEPTDEAALLSGTDAFNAYLEWCDAENLPAKERWTRRTFYAAMEERGVSKKKTAKGIALMGVRLAQSEADGPGIFGKD